MGNWVNKTFHKKISVRAIIYGADLRESVHWVIPNGNEIKVNGASYFVNDKDLTLSVDNVPTYHYTWNTPEPINAYTNRPSYLTAQEYDTAISAGEAKKVFDALPKKGDGNTVITFVLLGVVILAIGVLGYLGYKEIETLRAIIEEIKRKIDIISGV
jgi:hypothetical protein